MLYLGVDNGIYISHNDGESWMRLRNNLPPTPVYWLEIQERFDDLVVGTYGRGYYIMDNIAPLREFDIDAQGKEAHVFSFAAGVSFSKCTKHQNRRPEYELRQKPCLWRGNQLLFKG